ncbi:MAG: hypothetical protein PVF45_09915, partial [Anaerolineae bacterium]
MKTKRLILVPVLVLGLTLVLLFLLHGNPPEPAFSQVSYELYHVFFPRNLDGYDATLYLQNPGNLAANVHLAFYDYGVTDPTAEMDLAIYPWGSQIIPAGAVSGLSDGGHSLIVSADQAVGSVVRVQGPLG